MPGSIDNLDPSDGFMDFLRATHFNKGQASQGEDSDDGKSGSGGEVLTFAFKGKKISALDASIQPGEVELGPASVLKADGTYWVNGTQVATGRFTNSLTSLAWNATPTTGVTVWNVWAEIDTREDIANSVFPKWRIMEGEAITPLYDGGSLTEEFNLKWTRQKKILIIALVDDAITTVKNLQCGNIDISHL